MELKLEELLPYLRYRLKCLNQNLPDTEMVVEELIGVSNHITWSGIFNARHGSNHIPICGIKPILKPFSYFSGKRICRDVMEELQCDLDSVHELWQLEDGSKTLEQIKVKTYNVMCKNHIDFNRLIEKGLAININTLEL
jgi:hypothetical protein